MKTTIGLLVVLVVLVGAANSASRESVAAAIRRAMLSGKYLYGRQPYGYGQRHGRLAGLTNAFPWSGSVSPGWGGGGVMGGATYSQPIGGGNSISGGVSGGFNPNTGARAGPSVSAGMSHTFPGGASVGITGTHDTQSGGNSVSAGVSIPFPG